MDEKYCFRCEILYTAQKHGNSVARYFHFLSQMNSALKITSAILIPNLVKIGEKLCPLAFDKRENFVTAEVGRHACALNKSVWAVNGIQYS